MPKRKIRVFAADFETTVYDGQDRTDVWSAAICELNTENAEVYHSLPALFLRLDEIGGNILLYFHNLKFDGAFWLDFLLNQGFKNGEDVNGEHKMPKERDLKVGQMTYTISAMGQFYSLAYRTRKARVEIRDSYKLLPFTLKKIGEDFGLKHKKLEMEYAGERYPGCKITPEELDYIKNDVFVLKEALEFVFAEGHDGLTIGSCCLREFKSVCTFGRTEYERVFPNLFDIECPVEHGISVDAYIRRAYSGGWCYVNPKYQQKIVENGCTYDVNSLYPSVMCTSVYGFAYPTGLPIWFEHEIPQKAKDKFYFVRFSCYFKLKNGKFPFVHQRKNWLYAANENLVSSDFVFNGESYRTFYDENGDLHDSRITLTMSKPEFELFLENYSVEDLEVLDGCWFTCTPYIFDRYIEKYRKIKENSTGATRQLAKLFSNNLYGKMAASEDSSYKYAFILDNVVHFENNTAADKRGGYIPIGAAITAYARCVTIRAAQANYTRFCYADTDSIHLAGQEPAEGIKTHKTQYGCWDREKEWSRGWFVRQKTYLEEGKDGLSITCAGMSKRCKQLFAESVTQKHEITAKNDEERAFIAKKREITDFNVGLRVPSKLMPKRIPGGIVLVDTYFELR